jgi:uncharacterized membrane protein
MSDPNTRNSANSIPNMSSRLPGWLPFAILAAAGLVLWVCWDSIPGQWWIHWNARGEPDGWLRKTVPAVLSPVVLGVIVVLILEATKTVVARSTHRRVCEQLSARAALGFVEMTRDMLGVIQIAVALIFALAALVFPLMQPEKPWLFIAATLGTVVAAIGIGLRRWMKNARAMKASGLLEGVEGWNGVTYNNPRDPRLWVPKITGAGYTLNFARREAWFVLLGIIAVPVLLLILIFNFAG